jgi:hypothetical protein
MAQERLTMRETAKDLRLKWECGLSNRAVARSCSISHSTVGEYLRRAQEAGLSWPLPADTGEDTLFELLFPKAPVLLSPVSAMDGYDAGGMAQSHSLPGQ